MSLHPLPEPTLRHGRRPFAILRILAVALGVAAAVGMAAAGDPTPATGKVAAPAVADVVLARAALAALDADADLKGVHLVVSVVDRGAVIGGPVSNARQSRRAEEVVRAVPGIAEVRNNCFVALGPDPLLRTLADRMGSTLPPRPTLYNLPGVLTNHLTPDAPLPESAPVNPASTFAAADPPVPVVVRKPAGEPGVLGAPVGPAGPGSAAPAPPPVVPGVLTGTPGGANAVLTAAHEVRKTEARFARLTVEVRDGTLVVGGSAPLAADAWDFAQKLRSVPGVSRIAVGAVAGK